MRKTVVVIFAIFILPFLLISCSANSTEASKNVAASSKAAPFTLSAIGGESVSLSDFSGKAVLLEFTTTWCPYCITIIPDIKQIYADYKDQLEVVAIYVKESKKNVAELVEKYKLPYTVLLDSNGDVASEYKLLGVPTIIIVDKDGAIRYKGHKIDEGIIKKVVGK